MIQSGIFSGFFPYGLEETGERIKSHGFSTVQLDVEFKDMDLKVLDEQKCKRIRDAFRRQNLPICCVSAYTNLVYPEPEKRRMNLDRLKEIIRFARQLGSPYVVSGTGTFNAASDWVHDPRNKTEQGYGECRDIIGEIVEFAAAHDITFLVETYVNNIIGSVDEILRLFKDINHPKLKLLMDPTNYFEENNLARMDDELNHAFDELSDEILIAHAKDIKLVKEDLGVQMETMDADESHSLHGVGKIEFPAAGLGQLNYDLYLKRLSEKHPNIPIIIEHLMEEDVKRAKDFLDNKFIELGV